MTSSFKFTQDEGVYSSKVLNNENFSFIIKQVSLGSGLQLTAESITRLQSSWALRFVGKISEEDVARSVQKLMAMSFQTILNFFTDMRCYEHFVAFDAAINYCEIYTVFCICLCTGSELENLYVLTIPLKTRHM